MVRTHSIRGYGGAISDKHCGMEPFGQHRGRPDIYKARLWWKLHGWIKAGKKAAGGKKCNYQLVLARLLPKPAAEPTPLSQLRMNGVDVDMLPCPPLLLFTFIINMNKNLMAEFSQFSTMSPVKEEEEAVAGFIAGCANSGKPGPAGKSK